MPSQLGEVLTRAAVGDPPPPDGRVRLLAQPSARDAGVIAFTAHNVIFADVDETWLAARLDPDDLAAPHSPTFLAALAERLGRDIDCVQLLTAAGPLPGPPPLSLSPLPLATAAARHPRVRRALRYRDGVTAFRGGGALVVLGRGVAGRWEVAVEVEPEYRGRGLGRAAALAARHLVPEGAPLWAQIAPGNAASVRAFLAAGFLPVGAEALFTART